MDERDLAALKDLPVPEPGPDARARALEASLSAFREASATQGLGWRRRLTSIFNPQSWRWTMERRMAVGAAAASIAVLAIATQYTIERGFLPINGSDGVDVIETARNEVDGAGAPADKAIGERVDAARPVLGERTREAEETAVALSETRPGGGNGQGIMSASPPASSVLAGDARPARRQFYAVSRSAGQLDQLNSAVPMAESVPMPAPDLVGRDQFEDFEGNPVRAVGEDPVSTFSIDVDTASYAFVRRMLREGRMPPEDAVRVEEMINYFDYSYEPATSLDEPFRPTVAVYPTPWNANTKLLHIGLKGFEVAADDKPQANLVFLIDVSGSMESADKLPLLKSAFRLLLDRLDADDTVSIVTYAGEAGTALEPTRVSERRKILSAIDGLGAGGSTAGAAGIEAAYDLAEDAFVADGINRVILATDGDFNVGLSDPEALEDYIERKRKSGVYLSVLGFGVGNYNDALMQSLAQSGNGNAAYIDTLNEARKVLVDEAGSTIVPIAGDVKIQVEFNPASVAEYRLIGYETRALAREDFNNDKVDAGDIGSGHTVTAIYELTPVGSPARLVDDLRYQQASEAARPNAGAEGEYAFLRLRYKKPGASDSQLIERAVSSEDELTRIDGASADMRFAAAVAAFGQKLRETSYLGDFSYDEIAKLAAGARGSDPFGYRNEFMSLVRLADSLSGEGSDR